MSFKQVLLVSLLVVAAAEIDQSEGLEISGRQLKVVNINPSPSTKATIVVTDFFPPLPPLPPIPVYYGRGSSDEFGFEGSSFEFPGFFDLEKSIAWAKLLGLLADVDDSTQSSLTFEDDSQDDGFFIGVSPLVDRPVFQMGFSVDF